MSGSRGVNRSKGLLKAERLGSERCGKFEGLKKKEKGVMT